MSDNEAVLFANEAFYRAFADRDIAAMEAVWSHGAPLSCLHPGWGPLFGRDDVMASWAGILAARESPKIRPVAPRATVHGALALVVCFEALGESWAIATNVFLREGRVWKMVHHQAGPTAERPDAETESSEAGPLH